MIDLLSDPDLGAAEVTVLTTEERVNDNGYRVAETVTVKIIAIIQPSTPEERQVLPEAVRSETAITLYTVGRLGLDDQVIWQEQPYTVKTIEPWTIPGDSFRRVVAVRETLS